MHASRVRNSLKPAWVFQRNIPVSPFSMILSDHVNGGIIKVKTRVSTSISRSATRCALLLKRATFLRRHVKKRSRCFSRHATILPHQVWQSDHWYDLDNRCVGKLYEKEGLRATWIFMKQSPVYCLRCGRSHSGQLVWVVWFGQGGGGSYTHRTYAWHQKYIYFWWYPGVCR